MSYQLQSIVKTATFTIPVDGSAPDDVYLTYIAPTGMSWAGVLMAEPLDPATGEIIADGRTVGAVWDILAAGKNLVIRASPSWELVGGVMAYRTSIDFLVKASAVTTA